MKSERAINIAKGCVMASFMDSETKQMVIESLDQMFIPKTETVGVSSDGFSYDAKPKQYQCLGCRDYFYMPQVPAYCPNCGRRLENDNGY